MYIIYYMGFVGGGGGLYAVSQGFLCWNYIMKMSLKKMYLKISETLLVQSNSGATIR